MQDYKRIDVEYFRRLINRIEHFRRIDAGDDNMGTEEVLEKILAGTYSIEEACIAVDGYILLDY